MKKRSLTLAGHRTSVSLEPEFWQALDEEAEYDGVSGPALIGRIDKERLKNSDGGVVPAPRNLASALRIFVLTRIQSRLAAAERALSIGDEA